MNFKSGFVTIIGKPNVGKSTLLNNMVGEKVAIMSNRPQTTRNKITAVVTTEDTQIIFIDTPGIHNPSNKLGEYMVNIATNTVNEVDVILYVVDTAESQIDTLNDNIIKQLKNSNTQVILVINKIDLIEKEKLFPIIKKFEEKLNFKSIIPVSASLNNGLDIIISEIKKLLPNGPKYFPDDTLTDQPERVIVAEFIREKVLLLVNDEVPHGVGIEIIRFKEREHKKIIDIDVNIYCEKNSHKAILIGKDGSMLKKIGSLARLEVENLLGCKVHMQTWVKVKKDWRNSENMLKTLGYKN